MVALAILIGVSSTASAAPLAPDECLAIDFEKKSMEDAGVIDDFAQSPGLAQYTYAGSRLERMRRYLDIKEKVLFRCPNLVVLKATEVEATDAASPEAAAKAAAEAQKEADKAAEFGPDSIKPSR
jgi:hypothetical protein